LSAWINFAICDSRGAGLEYQFSRETTRDLGGHQVRINFNGSACGFRRTAFGERQTQAPTARQIFTEIPWLQPELDRLGLAASTPQPFLMAVRGAALVAALGQRPDYNPGLGSGDGAGGAGGTGRSKRNPIERDP
jgi:hypothetical protein